MQFVYRVTYVYKLCSPKLEHIVLKSVDELFL